MQAMANPQVERWMIYDLDRWPEESWPCAL
jgi:hypothetical protein